MKKVFTLMMAFALVLGLSVPAFAADLTGTKDDMAKSGTTEVTYGVQEGYTVTIPEDFDLVVDTDVEKEVSAADVLIAHGQKLQVAMGSANGFKVKYEGSEIAYTVKKDAETGALANNATVLEVTSGTTTGSAALKFNTTAADVAAATKAGDHKDTLTFSCSIV